MIHGKDKEFEEVYTSIPEEYLPEILQPLKRVTEQPEPMTSQEEIEQKDIER